MNKIHISLRTADLAASTAFYTELFGGAPDKVHDDHVRFQPADTPVVLTLMPGEPGVDHLGVRHSDGTSLQQQLSRLGRTPSEGVVCCHAKKAEAWLSDPDGRSWEVYAVTDEAPAAPVSTGCCA